ncbi:putative DNA repair protein RAD51-like protein 4 [Hypsibius exemplaris]|uniref:DNA repair protein RAD51-like protein 4 n=1 Tax=Hypsibius exemplaris TaxID=2072580 RepID=A0A1W0X1C1_HYPEX|nr:putative DNA repair protein RAD51-like protein 4 [Hypsibius exemplaris]
MLHTRLRANLPGTLSAESTTACKFQSQKSILFGCPSVDGILGGEFRCGQVVELCGPPLSGKTQLSMKLIATALQENESCRIFFMDTCGQFNPQRLFDILSAANCTPDEVQRHLGRVDIARVSTCERLLQLLDSCSDWAATHAVAPGSAIVIIDILHSLLAPFVGGKSFSDYRFLNAVGQALGYVSGSLGMTVLYTNSAFSSDGRSYSPALGTYWSSIPHHRLLLTRNKDDESFPLRFGVVVLRSISMPSHKHTAAEFQLDMEGHFFPNA